MLPLAYSESKKLESSLLTGRGCPRCGSRTFEAIEFWRGATATFRFSEGVCDKPADLDDQSGIEPYKLIGQCLRPGCKHEWIFRGARSVNGIERDEESHEPRA